MKWNAWRFWSITGNWEQNVFCFADPFADAIKGSDDDVQDGLVHIRIQQRNGRKTLTTVQGLSSEYDLKKIVRACKKVSYQSHSGTITWLNRFPTPPSFSLLTRSARLVALSSSISLDFIIFNSRESKYRSGWEKVRFYQI